MNVTRTKQLPRIAVLGLAIILAVQFSAHAAGGFSDPLQLLGIDSFECRCSQSRDADSERWLWLFMSEPKISSLDREGPSYGQLKPGDVIVAVDGMLITTRRAGERFSEISPGEAIELTIRRDGVERRELIVPRELAEPEEPPELVHLDTPLTLHLHELSISLEELAELAPALEVLAELEELTGLIELPELGELPELPELPDLSTIIDLSGLAELSELSELSELAELSELEGLSGLIDLEALDQLAELGELSALANLKIDLRPLGWFGMGLSFSGSMTHRRGEGEPPRWDFDDPPKVRNVKPDGPADRAGLRNGDLLTHIDGLRLDSPAGGELFSEIRPGDTVDLTVLRHGDSLSVSIVAEERPE